MDCSRCCRSHRIRGLEAIRVTLLAWLAIGLGLWLVDSAVRNRSPIAALQQAITTGTLPQTGVTESSAAPPPSNGAPSQSVPGNVDSWVAQAVPILESNGVPASEINTNDIKIMIMGESSGNPTAQNNSDSNAAAGHPSKGLMQTIDSTFSEWSVPGHTDIWNPVDNIVAATRYALNRYGSLDNVPGVIQVHNGQSYTAGY